MNEINILTNDYLFKFKKAFLEVLNAFQKIFNYSKKLIVDVLITNDLEMQKISKSTRQIDKTTDVLSFPFAMNCEEFNFIHLGEIILSFEQIQRQAKQFNHSIKREFCFLFAHGLVHLHGLDHKQNLEQEMNFNQFVYNIMEMVKIRR